jgi:hypothetical protein
MMQSRYSGPSTAVLGPGEPFFQDPSKGGPAKNLHTIFVLTCKIKKKQIPLPVITMKHGIGKENIYS